MPRALIILTEGVEEMEAIAPVDLLRRAGVQVILATIDAGPAICGRNNIALLAETELEQVEDMDFDLIVIPGGPGHTRLKAHAELLALLRRQVADGRTVAAICAGPLVLQAAGVLQGRRHTCHHSVAATLPERDPAAAVVEDGPVITSQGAGTATRFALALVRRLCGADKAAEIAREIAFDLHTV
jgi:4-methyl-5(b-hydroxyethyl)-thiazole monophosphate biosynthesis